MYGMLKVWFVAICVIKLAVCSPLCNVEVSKTSQDLIVHGNYNVACETSCPGNGIHSLMWLDNNFRPVRKTSRIFTVTYSRGRYSRLFILDADPRDAGSYVCLQNIGGKIHQAAFELTHDVAAEVVPERDEGPQRGDQMEVILPNRRPKRGAYVIGSGDDESQMEGSADTDTMNNSTGTMYNGTDTMYNSTGTMYNSTGTMYNGTGTMFTDAMYNNTDDMNITMMTTPIKPVEAQTDGPNKTFPIPTPNITWVTNPEPVPENGATTTPKKFTPLTTKTMVPKTEPEPEYKTTHAVPEPEGDPETPKPEPGGNTDYKPNPASEPEQKDNEMGPNTEFGRIGLVAFVLSLSIAFLLLYALILVLCIPKCLKKKRSFSLAGEGRSSTKATAAKPETIQLDKVQDNGLPSPGPSDAGFTTIDLDDADPKLTQKEEKDDDTLLTSVLTASPDPEQTQVKVEDQLPPESTNQQTDVPDSTNQQTDIPDSSNEIPETKRSNATPEVIDEPPRPVTETTEVILDVTENPDGRKQITLSTSSSPPPTPGAGDDPNAPLVFNDSQIEI